VAKVRLLDPTDSKRKLDRYELIGELASGGMATVFLGRLGGVGGFQRFVAIKRLHPHLASEEEFIEMFLDEARLAAGIHHPHVVPILEVGESESGYYLVMEYIEGDTLARIMARSVALAKPVPRPVLVKIVLDALAGLHAAHELTDTDGTPVHLVHRDVSPQNVLVGVDGCSRITDFGVAHAASRLSNTRADRLKGKLAYMSPEQARSAEIDRRSDVFAMGVILWEVLALKRLFKADNEMLTLQRVLNEPIPRLSQVSPGIHPAFDQVCAKALERDPDKRYKSAADMAESLERAARTAASTSPTDLGVASPREVASFVQGALGEDIAAQRESVRAWLAHSEPSLPRVTGVRLAPDITVKMPLDRSGPASSSGVSSVSSVSAVSAVSAVSSVSAITAPPSSQPGSRPSVTTVSAGNEPEMEPHEGVPDDDDEHETLLMDREGHKAAMAALGLSATGPAMAAQAPSAPASAPPPSLGPASGGLRHGFGEEGSASLEALAVAPPPPRRTPQLVAVVVALLLAGGAFVAWTQLRPTPTQAVEPPTPAVQPTSQPSAAPSTPEPTAATAAPEPTATASATALGAPRPAPRGYGRPLPKAKPPEPPPKPPEPPKAADPPKQPDPPKPPEPPKPKGQDEPNPYR
jgi:eukaryotic-like serine/threonine-protein kinase